MPPYFRASLYREAMLSSSDDGEKEKSLLPRCERCDALHAEILHYAQDDNRLGVFVAGEFATSVSVFLSEQELVVEHRFFVGGGAVCPPLAPGVGVIAEFGAGDESEGAVDPAARGGVERVVVE
jgi:hypothetical protein